MVGLNLEFETFLKSVHIDAKKLDLVNLNIGDNEAIKLMELLISNDFSSLEIRDCRISGKAAGIIGKDFRRTKITSLDLSCLTCPLNAVKIWEGLENSQLISLSSCVTSIEDLDAHKLLTSLKSTNITVFMLSNCSLNDDFALELAKNVKYLQLKVLNLNGNKVSNFGLKAIGNQLKYTKIFNFMIDFNNLTYSGVADFFESLKSTKVSQLSIRAVEFSSTSLRKIEQALKYNKRLYSLTGMRSTELIDFYLEKNEASFEAAARAIELFLNNQLEFSFEFRYELRGFELFQGDDDLWHLDFDPTLPTDRDSITQKVNLGIKTNFFNIVGVSTNRITSSKNCETNLSHLPDELLHEIAGYLLLADVFDQELEESSTGFRP